MVRSKALTSDTTILVRLWQETHDPAPRARIATIPTMEGRVATGIPEILAAVEEIMRSLYPSNP